MYTSTDEIKGIIIYRLAHLIQIQDNVGLHVTHETIYPTKKVKALDKCRVIQLLIDWTSYATCM